MQWSKIRNLYPSQWLLIEALEAHSEGEKRILDDLAVLETFGDVQEAMSAYKELPATHPSASSMCFTRTGGSWTSRTCTGADSRWRQIQIEGRLA
jgi:hypothetical protein